MPGHACSWDTKDISRGRKTSERLYQQSEEPRTTMAVAQGAIAKRQLWELRSRRPRRKTDETIVRLQLLP